MRKFMTGRSGIEAVGALAVFVAEKYERSGIVSPSSIVLERSRTTVGIHDAFSAPPSTATRGGVSAAISDGCRVCGARIGCGSHASQVAPFAREARLVAHARSR